MASQERRSLPGESPRPLYYIILGEAYGAYILNAFVLNGQSPFVNALVSLVHNDAKCHVIGGLYFDFDFSIVDRMRRLWNNKCVNVILWLLLLYWPNSYIQRYKKGENITTNFRQYGIWVMTSVSSILIG